MSSILTSSMSDADLQSAINSEPYHLVVAGDLDTNAHFTIYNKTNFLIEHRGGVWNLNGFQMLIYGSGSASINAPINGKRLGISGLNVCSGRLEINAYETVQVNNFKNVNLESNETVSFTAGNCGNIQASNIHVEGYDVGDGYGFSVHAIDSCIVNGFTGINCRHEFNISDIPPRSNGYVQLSGVNICRDNGKTEACVASHDHADFSVSDFSIKTDVNSGGILTRGYSVKVSNGYMKKCGVVCGGTQQTQTYFEVSNVRMVDSALGIDISGVGEMSEVILDQINHQGNAFAQVNFNKTADKFIARNCLSQSNSFLGRFGTINSERLQNCYLNDILQN